jgi:hypothetical protein
LIILLINKAQKLAQAKLEINFVIITSLFTKPKPTNTTFGVVMYVLIAFFISANPTSNAAPTQKTGVAMQEFSSQTTCEAARQIIQDELKPESTHTRLPVCVKK